jgi:hypothetical protein
MNPRNEYKVGRVIYSHASHAQPEPNCVAAASLNCSTNFSNEPKSLSISFRSHGSIPEIDWSRLQNLWYRNMN